MSFERPWNQKLMENIIEQAAIRAEARGDHQKAEDYWAQYEEAKKHRMNREQAARDAKSTPT